MKKNRNSQQQQKLSYMGYLDLFNISSLILTSQKSELHWRRLCELVR